MHLKSGEHTPQDAQFECAHCHTRVLLNEGQALPRCPECWGNEFRHAEELPAGSYEWLRLHDLRQR